MEFDVFYHQKGIVWEQNDPAFSLPKSNFSDCQFLVYENGHPKCPGSKRLEQKRTILETIFVMSFADISVTSVVNS